MINNISDIVVRSKVTLSRNVDDKPFNLGGQSSQVLDSLAGALMNLDEFTQYKVGIEKKNQSLALAESGLITTKLISDKGRALVNRDKSISVMLGEDDHIKEQCILSGLSVKEAYDKVSYLDFRMSGMVKYAFNPKYGYITSDIRELGTGMKVEVVVFLPALTMSNSLRRCVGTINKMNVSIRALGGDDSVADGYLYALSNDRTLGVTETDIIENMTKTAEQLAEAELRARDLIMNMNHDRLTNDILQAYGKILNSYMMTEREMLEEAAFVKLGMHYGLINGDHRQEFDRLIFDSRSANLSLVLGMDRSDELDKARAKYLGDQLKALISR